MLDGAFEGSAAVCEDNLPFDPSPFQPKYPEWCEILMHFSLLFYGFGSKAELLQDFGRRTLGSLGFVLAVDAFMGHSRMMQIVINSLSELVRPESRTMQGVIAALSKKRQKAFLIINSMESSFLEDAEARKSLIEAANSDCIFIVASIDRLPMMPLSFFTQMKFLPINVNTERFYNQEIAFGSSNKGHNSVGSIDRFTLVLRTLTNTALGIFKVLLKHQIKTGEGLGRSEWLGKSITALCTRLQSTFKGQITEFMDHRLVMQKKGNDVYMIPLTPLELEALEKGLEQDD
jgi:origin recognition complex subunit 2